MWDHCVTVLDDKLYVFGGDDLNAVVGTNLFMVLDLHSLNWTHLGGTSDVAPIVRYPGLRRIASMWAVPVQKRLYLLYGHAARSKALKQGLPHGVGNDWTLDDMWSYDIVASKWTRERLRGNFPCPRTEMACAYNAELGRTVVYGGYNAFLPMFGDDGRPFVYSFLGDAFVFDPTTKNWQQVIVKDFPSYRAQSAFLVNDVTGIIYLFGGRMSTAAYSGLS